MLTKCANPSCQTPFRYLHEGKLFVIPKGAMMGSGTGLADPSPAVSYLDYYWLCDACSTRMNISFQDGERMLLVPVNPLQEDWPMT